MEINKKEEKVKLSLSAVDITFNLIKQDKEILVVVNPRSKEKSWMKTFSFGTFIDINEQFLKFTSVKDVYLMIKDMVNKKSITFVCDSSNKITVRLSMRSKDDVTFQIINEPSIQEYRKIVEKLTKERDTLKKENEELKSLINDKSFSDFYDDNLLGNVTSSSISFDSYYKSTIKTPSRLKKFSREKIKIIFKQIGSICILNDGRLACAENINNKGVCKISIYDLSDDSVLEEVFSFEVNGTKISCLFQLSNEYLVIAGKEFEIWEVKKAHARKIYKVSSIKNVSISFEMDDQNICTYSKTETNTSNKFYYLNINFESNTHQKIENNLGNFNIMSMIQLKNTKEKHLVLAGKYRENSRSSLLFLSKNMKKVWESTKYGNVSINSLAEVNDLLILGEDEGVIIFKIQKGEPCGATNLFQEIRNISSIALLTSETMLFGCSYKEKEGYIVEMKIPELEIISSILLDHESPVKNILFDGTNLITLGEIGEVQIWS